MKKNVMMRIASFLLIAVLISTSAISGTYAKYVTSASGDDTARVAKFGVRITANGNMFAKGYEEAETISTEVEANSSVWSSNEDKLVAPGTAGEMVKMELTGTPEVDVIVTYEATNFSLKNWTLYDGTEYCPIIFNVNGETYGTEDTNATNKSSTVAELETAIKEAIADYSKTYEANQDLSLDTVDKDALAISWQWPFHVNSTKDAKDTILGDKAAGVAEDGTSMPAAPATIEIKVKTTVTQID